MKNIDFNIFQPSQTNLKPAAGRILIAEPFLQGLYFSRSIILLTEHNETGTVGFVLNKSTEVYPDELIEDILSFEGELFVGGPVSPNTLSFLHTLGPEVPGAVKITKSVYWGGDFEFLKKMINDGKASSQSVKFFAGYSGWAPAQLEGEIAENSWIVSSPDDGLIMTRDVEDTWEQAMQGMGEIYKTWTNFPRNPTFN